MAEARMALAAGAGVIPRRNEAGPAPLSFAQERLWVLDQFEPHTPLYNVPIAFDLEGELDPVALEKAFRTVVARHQALRTTFENRQGMPLQIVSPEATVEWKRIEAGAQVQTLLDEEARRPFDLSLGPLLRVVLARLGPHRHVLQFNIHHIAYDGWSQVVLTQELSRCYADWLCRTEPCLEELPLQYPDYAVWQRKYLLGETLERQSAYWRRQLAGVVPLELPGDHPRPPRRTWRGDRELILLPERLCQALRDTSRVHGVTCFMTLLAAWQALLHRYTGQTDICIGAPTAGRTRQELEPLIGFFVNTLALRADLGEDPTFRALLAQTRRTALEAYSHQDLPFEKVVEVLQVERSLRHTPLFQAAFAWQNAGATRLDFPGVRATRRETSTGAAKFDLTLSLRDTSPAITGTLEYSTDLFEAATIRRLWGHYCNLLEAALCEPDRRISTLPLLDPAERHQLLVERNRTRRDYPPDAVPELFAAQAARRPQAVAVVCGDQHLSYAELNRQANRLAHRLRDLGVELETPVGIVAERSLELVVGLLGILKAGAAYVPVSPSDPPERRIWLLRDAGVELLLTQERVRELVAEASAEHNPGVAVGLDHLVCVMYTSGSTGTPKGVEVVHRGIVRLLFGVDYARFGENEVWLQLAPVSFDASTLEIWGALLHGGRLVLCPTSVPTAAELADVIRSGQITSLWLPASLFHTLIDEAPETLAEIRQLLTGGEALSAVHVRRALDRLPATDLINGYGPTEGTTFTCCYRIPRDFDPARGAVPLGSPVSNTQIYVLDGRLQPVPAGVPGELCIGGDGLARGYRGRPDLTAEKFVPHPFGGGAGARLYRSGDLVRCRSDGTLDFLGRLDDQVKIRGFRIEPGEISATLERHPAVREAVVTVREDRPGDRRLAAYVVAQPGRTPAIGDLQDFLRHKLPEYLVPAAFVLLEALPRTPRGKVDRKALPAPPPARRQAARGAPRDPLERELGRLWEQVLGVYPSSAADDFFALGGTSLKAVRLFAALEKKFGTRLPLAALFEAPTIERLAEVLRRERPAPSWSSLVPLRPQGSRPPLFCVHGVGGNVLSYRDLARCLGPEQPVYGLQAVGLDGHQAPHTRVEQMAACYIREIREVQPAGPYLLSGMSFGGVVALEMARQLEAQGEWVGLLVLFDTHIGSAMGRPPAGPRLRYQVRRIRYHAAQLLALSPAGKLDYLRRRWKTLRRRIRSRLWQRRQERQEQAGIAPLPGLRQVREANILANLRYHPQPFGGRAVLFRALDKPLLLDRDPFQGWNSLIGSGLEIREIPGGHLTIMHEPHVLRLAAELRPCLERAVTSPPSIAARSR